MNDNKDAAKALKQIELIKKFGHRPDTWLYDINQPEIVWQPDRPDVKISLDEAEEIVDALDLPAIVVLPDNGQ
ncbi:hypothetical protein WBG78_26045 [Chryseolinea sp. T2]|uniref:hypothetical protein n=1 Tax=Chryseolinea sp. T2 TaxID=3129255 RepID=UPI0030784E65